MISTDQVQQLIDSQAVGPDGSKIGKVGQVYLDDSTGNPEWVTVSTGLFGTRETFVPLARAQFDDDRLQLPYDKSRIKDAPNVDVESGGHLSAEEEDELYRYYGLGAEEQTDAGTTDTADAPAGHGTSGQSTGGQSTGGESTGGQSTGGQSTGDAMTRSEERIRTGTERRETGRARLRKYVVTHQEQVTVPVSHEEVRVETEPITDANRDAAHSGQELGESEHEVVLTEERPVVGTETVPVERVRLAKEQVQDQEDVTVDVREEKIETETERGSGRRR